MNKQNNKDFEVLMEAVDLIPVEPRRQILEIMAEVESKTDEEISNTIQAIRITLGEDFGIVT